MMRRKRPRILGSLRNPVLPQASSPPSVQSNSVHFFPSQTPLPQPVTRFNPLSVFYPTSFPALKNTSYFPTLMIAMPSSSCVNKLSSKHSAYFTTPSYLSTLMTTSSTRAPLDSCLDPLSHPEASYLQPDWAGVPMEETALLSRYQGNQSWRQRLEIMKWKRLKPWITLRPSLRKHRKAQPHWRTVQVVIGQEWMFYQIAISGWRKQRGRLK
ncbi:uncharacterized protein 1700129C05Rikl isoform X3 [Rattus norvegicus]|uniref:uncharacterized protein 1700129C05Rikl isoform X3 n=1 Tax=Rattus norvegicus TaxID=10116 RepID=UPI0019175FDC|nr:uncharacterized protein LOC691850 isoform X2 [Rattus norvegicus]